MPKDLPVAASDLGTPVQVVLPAGLLPRLVEPLAMFGMRLYRLPTKGEATLMIAADLSEFHDPQDFPPALTTAYVLEAWSAAVESLAEATNHPLRRPKVQRRKTRRSRALDVPAEGEQTREHL